MNKFKAEAFIQQVVEKLSNETNHLHSVSDIFGYHKIRNNDDMIAVIENTDTGNHAIIFKTGLTFFVSTLHDINEGSEIRRYTGHSHEGLVVLLDRKFSKKDYENPVKDLNNEEVVINY